MLECQWHEIHSEFICQKHKLLLCDHGTAVRGKASVLCLHDECIIITQSKAVLHSKPANQSRLLIPDNKDKHCRNLSVYLTDKINWNMRGKKHSTQSGHSL